jgi:uncharacterized Zn-finger protein
MEFDMSLLLKVPEDYDVNKIGFILLDDDTDGEQDSMEIDFELTPKLNAVNPPVNKDPTCHICDKSFSSRSNLKRHLTNFHVVKPPKRFQCRICGKTFEKQQQLSGHFRIHGSSKIKPWYTCDHCGKTERSRSAIRQHLEIHQGIFDIKIDELFM